MIRPRLAKWVAAVARFPAMVAAIGSDVLPYSATQCFDYHSFSWSWLKGCGKGVVLTPVSRVAPKV